MGLKGNVKKTYRVYTDTRQKDFLSSVRKLFTAGEEREKIGAQSALADIFGQVFVIDASPEDCVRATAKFMIDGKEKDVEDILPVLEMINTVISKSKELEGVKVRIEDYKPTPKEGEALKSSGPGGGAKIRLAKFKIAFYDEASKKLIGRQEVQIFAPSEKTGKSAWHYYFQKNLDDPRYAAARLTELAGKESVFGTLYPQSMYPEELEL